MRRHGKPTTRARSSNRAAPVAIVGPPRSHRLIDTLSSAERKTYPIASGLLDYFPDACAAVANISYRGNQKHNPGQPLHHSRGKSMDHADCIARHLTERGKFDSDGSRHSAQLAWRAFALLQEELEQEFGLPLPRNARFDTDAGSSGDRRSTG